jgi:hypothetical protein
VRGGRCLRRDRVLGTLRTKSGSAFGDSTLKDGLQEGKYCHDPRYLRYSTGESYRMRDSFCPFWAAWPSGRVEPYTITVPSNIDILCLSELSESILFKY